jgi:hypothetical protein
MPKLTRDTRPSCPHCGVKAWSTDYASFMRDHDRIDGRKCRTAARRQSDADRDRGVAEQSAWNDTSAELR